MNGTIFDHYWVDVTDSGYTHGDRQTPILATSIQVSNVPSDTNCVFIAAVTTTGVQGDVAGPVCY
jgi:hypothetical protein